MWHNFSFRLAFVLFICCGATVSSYEACQEENLKSWYAQVEQIISTILSPTKQQTEELRMFMEETVKGSSQQDLSRTPKITIHSCGIRNDNNDMSLDTERASNQTAMPAEITWMVAIMLKSTTRDPKYIGGASLVAPNVVLSAAYTVRSHEPDKLVARMGDWHLESTDEMYPHYNRAVKQVIIHDQYSGNREYNIALLLLEFPVMQEHHISPICLPSSTQVIDYAPCIITGWGKISQNSTKTENVLKMMTVPVLPRGKCNEMLQKILGPFFRLEMSSICAGGEAGVDACLEDGGSPLVCPYEDNPNRYYQAGIVSAGIGCGQENVPGIYTNVHHLMPWICRELNKLNISSNYCTLQ